MTIEKEGYEIFLRDSATFDVFERLDIWTNLTIIMRFNDVGTWNLEIPKSSQLARWMSPNIGIVVKFEGITIFSGSAGLDYEETKNTIKIAGRDDNFLLISTARPTPSVAEAPYPDEYDVTTGVASTIMRSLVDRNIGPTAPSQWRIPQLILAADPVLGSAITSRARFDPLLTLLKELASTPLATGLGFKILQSETTPFKTEFSVYEPRDKHIDTVFSVELETAKDYVRKHRLPDANWFIVAGGDDFGINRTIVEGGDTDAINQVGRRIPYFADERGVTDLSELNQKLAEYIAGAVVTNSIVITPTDLPLLRFPEDYNIGDYVTGVVNNVEYPLIITEIEIQFDPSKGTKIIPTLADPGASNDNTLSLHLNSVSNRLSNIERNWNVPTNSIIAEMLHETQRWYVGDIKLTARGSAQPGWLLCIGTAISRTTYSELFAQIGTLFGAGNGTTTFNIPDWRDRYPVGAGSTYTRGQTTTGSTSIAHTHTHSHGGGTLAYSHYHNSQAHTHPGSHSHDFDDVISHTHQTNIDHDHPSFNSGGEDTFAAALSTYPGTTTNVSHRHAINVPALGTTEINSSTPNSVTGSASTDQDNAAHAASYSGSPSNPTSNVPAWTGGSDPDSTSGGGSVTVIPASQAINYEIYTGVL